MKLYLAPMEGITNHIYRRAWHRHFGPADRYFAPFLTNIGLNHKELADLLPENNKGMELVPQILTNRPEIFLELAETLRSLGYTEVNLNLGCPSGTVTAKGRGSGFLRDPRALDEFLEKIFARCPLRISVKTRIGYADEAEWPPLWELLSRYPFSERIIHPRLRSDFYRGPVRIESFAHAYRSAQTQIAAAAGIPASPPYAPASPPAPSGIARPSACPCYNGDIFTHADFQAITTRFPALPAVMLGRGLITNPGLARELRGQPPMKAAQLRGFLEELEAGYRAVMSGDKNVLYRLMEVWSYLSNSFDEPEKIRRRIRKAANLAEYEQIIKELLP